MRPLAGLAAPVYRWEIGRRNRAFDAGRGVTRLDLPVISVGNLSAGGTGKTPMVARIVAWLLEAGVRPCIAMRGYGAPPGRGFESDEAREYRARFDAAGEGGVALVAQPDRLAGIRTLVAGGAGVDCVVLDDGFQHRRIARDLDIVLVHGAKSPFADRLLPLGWLREGPSSLGRADAVVVTHAERVAAGGIEILRERIRAVAPGALIAVCRHAWSGLNRRTEGRDERVSWLRGRRVVAACGIGDPEAFLDAARGAVEGELCETIVRRDHDAFADRTVEEIVRAARTLRADAVLMTEKDWAKLARVEMARWPCPVVSPVLELEFDSGEEDLRTRVLEAVGRVRG